MATDGRGFCWGWDADGEVGNGITIHGGYGAIANGGGITGTTLLNQGTIVADALIP